jgi:hypothetical protein
VEIFLIFLLGIEDTCMVAMRRQLSPIKEDWLYSLIVHVLGMFSALIFSAILIIRHLFIFIFSAILIIRGLVIFIFSAVIFSTLKHEIFSLLISVLVVCRWKSLKRQLFNMRAHSDVKGIEIKRANESVYTFPCPDCMCRSNK